MTGLLGSNSIIPTPSRFYHSSTDNPGTLAWSELFLVTRVGLFSRAMPAIIASLKSRGVRFSSRVAEMLPALSAEATANGTGRRREKNLRDRLTFSSVILDLRAP